MEMYDSFVLIGGSILSIIFIGISACWWKYKAKDEWCYEPLGWAFITFIVAPTAAFFLMTIIDLIIDIFGFWLIPIVLIICLVLVFVYWGELIKWLKDKKDGDEQCG